MTRILMFLAMLAPLLTLAAPALCAENTHEEHTDAEHAAAKAAAGAAGSAHEEEGSGSPITSAKDGLIPAFTTIIIFLVLVIVLGKFAWGPIASGLKEREDKIRKDIKDAEDARAKAEAALAQYNRQLATAEAQMRDILSKAAVDAEKLATQMKMTAQQEAEEIKERATRDIESARKAAISDIYAQAAELSTSIASKILRRNLNADDQRDLVNASIQQFSTAGKA